MKFETLKPDTTHYAGTTIAEVLIQSVYAAGNAIKGFSREATVKAGEGHRSVVTKADLFSNEKVLGSFEAFPEVTFLCEEDTSANPRIIAKENPIGVFDGYVVVLDSLDGTSVFARRDPDWCVGAGLFKNGVAIASAITAPQANGGTSLFSVGTIALAREGNEPGEAISPIVPKPTKECTILRGVDTELYANILSVMPKIAASVRAVDIKGSGHFGLMSVALGRADAIIQTPQKPWDWAPAYHAVTTAGGIFRFFRLKNGNLIPVDHYDQLAFKAGKENRLGFIAGEPTLVEKLFSLLPKTNWERHDPDTI